VTESVTERFARVKSATVALAVMADKAVPLPPRTQPFEILGSGFCVDARGAIVTCAHVVEAFMEKTIKDYLKSIPPEERSKEHQRIPDTRGFVPHAIFYEPRNQMQQVLMVPARVDLATAKTNMDLGLLRLRPHAHFKAGYPVAPIEDFEAIHEGMEVATCGFPLGSKLFQDHGTATSSFSRGIISSIIPTAGASKENTRGFQLDLRATHGNSGGPVFSWHSGRVIGVLQGGINDDYGNHLFSQAESIYRLFDGGLVEEVLLMRGPTG
jgi:S1-C subfamily serine protease